VEPVIVDNDVAVNEQPISIIRIGKESIDTTFRNPDKLGICQNSQWQRRVLFGTACRQLGVIIQRTSVLWNWSMHAR
jgi:hypothetical protein